MRETWAWKAFGDAEPGDPSHLLVPSVTVSKVCFRGTSVLYHAGVVLVPPPKRSHLSLGDTDTLRFPYIPNSEQVSFPTLLLGGFNGLEDFSSCWSAGSDFSVSGQYVVLMLTTNSIACAMCKLFECLVVTQLSQTLFYEPSSCLMPLGGAAMSSHGKKSPADFSRFLFLYLPCRSPGLNCVTQCLTLY